MFQVLAEVISPEELFGLITFAKLVHMIEVFQSRIPNWRVWKFLAAISTYISRKRPSLRYVEGGLDAGKRSTRPRVPAQMQGVLMTLRFILVFKSIRTVLTDVLLL